MHRRDIARWRRKAEQTVYTIVPLKKYMKSNRAKVELGLVRGKRHYDNRQVIGKRESDRTIRRAMMEAADGSERHSRVAGREK